MSELNTTRAKHRYEDLVKDIEKDYRDRVIKRFKKLKLKDCYTHWEMYDSAIKIIEEME